MSAFRARTVLVPAALAALLILPVPALAQHHGDREPERSRFSGSLSFMNTQPLGDLRTGPGFGAAASAAWALDSAHRFRIRGDFRVAGYGHEERRVCAGGAIGCWIQLDVNTTYSNVYGGIGPEIALPVLGTELVLDATAGVGYFGVSSSLEGINDNESFGTTNHHDDAVFAWSAGGELRIPVSREIGIAIGTHYLHNGQASYVVEGGISQNPDGSLNVVPLNTEANMVAITVGISVWPTIGEDDDDWDDRRRRR